MLEFEEKECVLDLGQSRNNAAVKGAQIKLKMEECVKVKEAWGKGKGQSLSMPTYAVLKGAQI